MAIGSSPITWDLKHTGELWVYIGTPLPNSSGNTGEMVMLYPICQSYPCKLTSFSSCRVDLLVVLLYL